MKWLCVAAGAVCALAMGAHAQPDSQSPIRTNAWAPRPVDLPPYVGTHKPHWKLSSMLADHAGREDWSVTLADDRHLLAQYVSMAPGNSTPRRFHPDTRVFWIVQAGQIRFAIEGQEPFVASKGFLVQVPDRTPYRLETVGAAPSLRLEVMVGGASTFYTLDETPVPAPGMEFVKVTLPGRGQYDESNRPYLDFPREIVDGGGRAGMFVRDDRLMAVIIRGPAEPRPPDTDRGHIHVDYSELWFVLEGKVDYLIEGLPFFTAEQGDVVYAPAGRFHRPTFGGTGMATRVGINGFHSGVHVELLSEN